MPGGQGGGTVAGEDAVDGGVDIIGQPIYVKHFTNGSRTDFNRGA